MDLTTLSSLSGMVAILAPLCMVALFAWVIFRTASRHTLLFRLWQLIQGNREISDPAIRSYVDEQNSLMSFRFIAGVAVSNLEQAHQLLRWSQLRKVEMYELRRAGDYFDSEFRVIHTKKLPGKVIQGARLAGVSLAVAVFLLCCVLMYSDSAVMKITSTGRWILMSGSEAKTVWPLMQSPVIRANCTSDVNTAGRDTSFTDQEVKVLCKVLTEEDAAGFVQKNVQGRWKSALLPLVEMFVIACIFFTSFMSGFAARRLANRNIDPSLDDEQSGQPSDAAAQSVKSEVSPSEVPAPQ